MNHSNHIILLVEDDPDDVLMIKEVLGNKPSIDIVHKKNGLEALSYLQQNKLNGGSLPCLIIMDINMPKLNGKQLLSLLKNEEEFYSIPMIVFTTSSTDGDKEYCQRFNVPMITKPYDTQAFNDTVEKFIEHCDPVKHHREKIAFKK